jgi:PAS domain S-box-containing protein
MIKKFSISNKITLLVLAVVLLSVIAISFVTYRFANTAYKERYTEGLAAINRLKADKIEDHLSGLANGVTTISSMPSVQEAVAGYNEGAAVNADSARDMVSADLAGSIAAIKEVYNFDHIAVLDNEGNVIEAAGYSATEPGSQYKVIDGYEVQKGQQGLYISNINRVDTANLAMRISAPIENPNGGNAGVVVAQFNANLIFDILQDTTGLGQSGESYIGNRFSRNQVDIISPLRNSGAKPFEQKIMVGEKKALPIQAATDGKSGADIGNDYRDSEVLAVWNQIPLTGWGIVTQMDTEEIDTQTSDLLKVYAIAGLVIIIICLLVAIIFSRVLISPLLSLKNTLQLLSRGVLPETSEVRSNDEIGQMGGIVEQVVSALKRTANFAYEIGDGKFDTDFTPLSEQDTLGTSLINMRNSIQEAEVRDKERNWIVTGVAEIGDILRQHTNLEELGDAVIAYVTEKIGAIQGAFYVVNDDNKSNAFIELKASYAYNKKKYLKGSYKFAEGLVGQAAIEQDTLVRTEIPREYVTVTSGLLGEQRPDCLLIVPLMTNEQVYGVMEFAGFGRFTPKHQRFVEEISVIIARTIFNIKVNERTRNLLTESQNMSKELQMQQEVLRQNAEEMEATQEELKRTNHRLEEQIDEVGRTQKRMQLLLENASEVITIYEGDATVRYISPSVESILGYNQDELIGKRDMAYVHPDNLEAFESMFKQLLDNPNEAVTVQFQFKRKDGDWVWLEAVGHNLLNDPAIQGMMVNTRDITERRRAEQETRMRSQMQALSENSPDLITRLNLNQEVFYINPTIEQYTGNRPEELMNKSIQEAGFNQIVVDQLAQILRNVEQENSKVSTELNFPSDNLGDRIMQVNAIPEYNDVDELESVLVVSHDITERKLIELEIQAKNKKINDSINYAQRIQSAILPDNDLIRKLLPDSFILYKPRDVVSGDFPWFMQVGDNIYLAAVDATGHGVPGALISLIGYFLLNDIVRSRKIEDPGKILDALDAGVTSTLRQDEEGSKTKDGMDISLCKINLKDRTVEYAGAHRPLYYMSEGELTEIKGDRFPIGGGTFKNQTDFTSTKIEIKPGDAVYYCSDGFPDQFGGPDNRKFGPRRLREIITSQSSNSMPVQKLVFEEAWMEWMGETKQTDDMLLIGIRF